MTKPKPKPGPAAGDTSPEALGFKSALDAPQEPLTEGQTAVSPPNPPPSDGEGPQGADSGPVAASGADQGPTPPETPPSLSQAAVAAITPPPGATGKGKGRSALNRGAGAVLGALVAGGKAVAAVTAPKPPAPPPAPQDGRTFHINGKAGRKITSVPWALVEAHRAAIEKAIRLPLEVMAKTGGMQALELVRILYPGEYRGTVKLEVYEAAILKAVAALK